MPLKRRGRFGTKRKEESSDVPEAPAPAKKKGASAEATVVKKAAPAKKAAPKKAAAVKTAAKKKTTAKKSRSKKEKMTIGHKVHDEPQSAQRNLAVHVVIIVASL
jgi:hypothetical protein